MYTYTVICAKEYQGSLAAVARFDPDAVIEFEDFTDGGDEVYTIETEYAIDHLLDESDGVVNYEVEHV